MESKSKCLIVVDVQKDFFKGGTLEVIGASSLINPLNSAIKSAIRRRFILIYTRDFHPENHFSFNVFGGPWPRHCVRGTKGTEFHDDLYIYKNAFTIDVGTDPKKEGYSPYENPLTKEIIIQNNITEIYVSGIALEYCVKATCLDSLKFSNKVFAIIPLIRSISQDEFVVKSEWDELKRRGIKLLTKFT